MFLGSCHLFIGRCSLLFLISLVVMTIASDKLTDLNGTLELAVVRNASDKESWIDISKIQPKHSLVVPNDVISQIKARWVPVKPIENYYSVFTSINDLNNSSWGKSFLLTAHLSGSDVKSHIPFALSLTPWSQPIEDHDKTFSFSNTKNDPITIIIKNRPVLQLEGVRTFPRSTKETQKPQEKISFQSILTNYWWVLPLILIISALLPGEQEQQTSSSTPSS